MDSSEHVFISLDTSSSKLFDRFWTGKYGVSFTPTPQTSFVIFLEELSKFAEEHDVYTGQSSRHLLGGMQKIRTDLSDIKVAVLQRWAASASDYSFEVTAWEGELSTIT